MLFSFCNPAAGVSEPPGDFSSNYRDLKKLINRALKEGTPIEDLNLVPRHCSASPPRKLSREDLLKLLHTIRRIKTRYQRLLQSPVPRNWNGTYWQSRLHSVYPGRTRHWTR